MSTITERNWQMLMEVRKELGLDKEPEPEPEDPRTNRATYRYTDKRTGEVLEYERDRPHEPQTNPFPPNPVELSMSEWIAQEAKRSGYAPAYVRQKFCRGEYNSRINIRKIHYRLTYISEKKV